MRPRNLLITVIVACGFVISLVATLPDDADQYPTTFEREGLLGFLLMPSVLVLQIWGVLAIITLLPYGLRIAYRREALAAQRPFLIGILCAAFGIGGHVIAICGLAAIRGGGMFMWGSAAILGLINIVSLLLQLVSAICILAGYSALWEHSRTNQQN